MKRFFDLMEGTRFDNPELHMAWQSIEAYITGAASYLEAGHDPRAVLARVAKQVRAQLEDFNFRMNGKGGDMDKGATERGDGKSSRPLDNL